MRQALLPVQNVPPVPLRNPHSIEERVNYPLGFTIYLYVASATVRITPFS